MKSKIFAIWMCAMLVFSSAFVIMGDVEGKAVDDTPKATWNVPGDFLTIQLAINGAGIGDTITVDAGTYTENVIVTKQLTIIGEDRDTTIINANYVSHGVEIVAASVSLSGFHVMNAVADNGIYVNNANLCDISNNIVSNSYAGIYVISDNTIISNNHVYDNGWVGIRLWGSENNTVWGNNASLNDQGINLYGDANTNTIYSNTLFNNSDDGIYLASSYLNTFYNNDVSYSNHSILFDNICSGNVIYNNNFKNANIDHVSDPAPAGNFYDNGLPDGGNYWDDYAGADTDFDNIGDTLVPHPAANFDQFPWVNASGWNSPCTANDDNVTINEDTIYNGNVTIDNGNGPDVDPDGDTITVIELDGIAITGAPTAIGSGALVTLNWDGTFDYDPNWIFESLGTGDWQIDTFDYTIFDNNGTYDNATVFVNVTGVNDAPAFGGAGGTLAYTEGDGAAIIDSSLIITDPDDANLEEAWINITANYQISKDILDFVDMGGITKDVAGSDDDKLHLTGTATVATYELALESVTFENTASNPTTGTRTITWQMADGELTSSAVVSFVSMNPVNNDPIGFNDTGIGFTTDEETAFITGNVTINDTDAEGDMITVFSLDDTSAIGLVTNGTEGAFNYDPNGQFEYLALGEQALDFFNYTLIDGNGGSDIAMVNITIDGVNDALIAVDDGGPGFITNEDTPFTTNDVLTNDTDLDNSDTLSVDSFSTASTIGQVTENGDGTFDYDPNGQFEYLAVGEQTLDFFNYTATDGTAFDTAMVTIIITGVNDAPTAVDDGGPGFITDEDTPFTTSNVLTNDTELDNSDTLSVDSFSTASTIGQVTDNGDGTFDYDPNGQFEYLAAGEQAIDFFNYTVTDGLVFDTAMVKIIITGQNDAPVLDPIGNKALNEETLLSFTATASDIDAPDTWEFSLEPGAPAGAAITLGGDFTWTPTEAQGPGTYFVTIVVTDDGTPALNDTETIQIDVGEVNLAPTLTPIGDLVADEEALFTFTVTATDPDLPANTLTFGLGPGAPAGASLSSGGAFSWTPTEAQGPGVYSITFNVTDGEFNATETIEITVNEVNVAPAASNDAITILEDAAATTIDVLVNDEDHDNNTIITIIAVTNGTHGTVTITNGGADLTYEPDADFFGTDTFTYNVTDGEFEDTATVTITVTNVNDDPLAVDDAASVDEDSSTTISVLINDGFAPDEGETLTIASVTQGSHGTVTIASGDLRVIYQPDANYVGTDTFTYTISDGNGGTATATVTMTVNNVNDNPTITTTGTASAIDGYYYNVDFDAIDIDGDAIEWSFTGADWLNIDSAGVLNGSAITGTYTIRVTASDGNGGSDTHTYTLTVEELDSDGDGVPDDVDAFPDDADETVDSDEDGIGNNADTDDDNDGVSDEDDDFPLNPTGATDTDNDGKPDTILEAPEWTGTVLTEDTDDDGDGVLDVDDPEPTDSSITGNEYDTGWPYWYVLAVIGIAALIALICLGVIWLLRKYVIE